VLAGWNKGLEHKQQTKEKIRQKALGRVMSAEARLKISFASTDRKHSEETKRKLHLLFKNRLVPPEWRQKISKAMTGKKRGPLPEETRRKISLSKVGTRNPMYGRSRELSPSWRGGVSKHPKYMSFMNRRRLLRKQENGGSHTLEEWELLKEYYGFTCPSCLRKEPEIQLTEDHIIPVKLGGPDFISNIQPLCRSCNSRKKLNCTKYEPSATNIA